jgi:ribosomal protein L23
MKINNDIHKLLVTEKSTFLKDKNVYAFKVSENLSKHAISSLISGLFGVEVLKVRTSIMPSKPKTIYSKTTRKQTNIRTGRFKKAYVEIKNGQVIDLSKETK